MMTMIPAEHRYCVVAPSGEVLRWTIANTETRAIGRFLGELGRQLWPWALMQGYRVRNFKGGNQWKSVD